MKKQMLNPSNKILILGLFLSLIICDLSSGQQLNKAFEDIGGGSGSTTTNVESNDDYTLYIVGGLIVTGIVVYALLRDKKEKPTSDTTAAILDDEIFRTESFFQRKGFEYAIANSY